MHPELFPAVPEDLAAVEPDELRGLLEQFTEIASTLVADMRRPAEEREVSIGEMTAAELMDVLRIAATDRQRIEAALAERDTAEQNFLDELATVAGDLGVEASAELAAEEEPVPTPDPDEPSDPVEPEVVAEPATVSPEDEALVALAGTETEPEVVAEPEPRVLAIPRGPSRFEPRPTADAEGLPTLVATRGLGAIKVREGTPLDRLDYANAVMDLARRLGPVKHVRGGSEDRHPIASLTWKFPEEFTLKGDPDRDVEKLRAVSSAHLGMPNELDVFQAAGGVCAPPTPFYDVPGFASRARPVRDALPSFQAVRGGVSLPAVNTISRTDTGVDVIEEVEDALGGTYSVKSCRTVACVSWTDTFIGVISHCLTVGTLNARTWPEGVALEQDNQMAAHAAVADARLLDRIKALSIQVASAHVYNGLFDFIFAAARAKAAIRNRLRADIDPGFTALIPEWVREFLVVDLAAQSNADDRYVATTAIESYFNRLGISVAWYKDSPNTAPTQNFAAEAGGAIDEFPTQAQWALFINGTFLHLDGGSLELGLVRDSVLNSTNDHQLFGEIFENVARVGPTQAALWLTSTICPSGTFPTGSSALAC